MNRILLAIALAAAAPAFAETCKYVDGEGRITYSNVPVKNAKKMMCFEPLDPVSPKAQKRKNQGPADFPKVGSAEQKQRDDARRKILQEELAAEEQRLAEAKKALEEGREKPEVYQTETRTPDGRVVRQARRNVPKYEAKIKQLEEEVARHEKNIEALKKELGNIK